MNTRQTGNNFREYYLLFENSDNIKPWMRRWFTKPNFEHVSVFMPYENGTLCVSQTVDNIEIFTWPYNCHAFMDTLAQTDCKILYLPKIHKKGTVWKKGIMIPSCVALCQRITGVSFNVITPHGYYKALLKHGAIPMKGPKKQDDSLMKEQLAMQKQQLEDQKKQQDEATARLSKEEAAKEDLKKRQRLGRKSLLGTTGDELGVA